MFPRLTIAKIWKNPGLPRKLRQKRESKFVPYFEDIKTKFENNSVTVKDVFKYFQSKDPDVFTSHNLFKEYVRTNKLTGARTEFLKVHVY